MRKETARLAEAARALRLVRTGRPAPHSVKIGVAAAAFPDLLADLQGALEAFDAAGALAQGKSTDEPVEAERMRAGVDAVFRWIKLQGMDTTDPMRMLGEALTGRPAKRQQSYDMMPSFAAAKVKKKGGWKPKMSLSAEVGQRPPSGFDMAGHARLGADMAQVASKMGAVAPLIPARKPSPVELEMDVDPPAQTALSA